MKYFGTDGIRKTAAFFTEQFVATLSAAVVSLAEKPFVVIARDPRESGNFIEKALADSFVRAGFRVVSLGMTATPVLAYCTKMLEAGFGVMVSASHNPPEYNGIKFFDGEGRKISEECEAKIEALIDGGCKLRKAKGGSNTPMDADSAYIDSFSELLRRQISPKRVLLDTANGAMSNVAPRLFEALGCRVQTMFCDTSGANINIGCGATAPKAFLEEMSREGCDIGFCFDGDGDRLLAYCGGRLTDGDHIMYVIAKYLAERGELNGKTLVGTIMSNSGVEKAAAKAGFTFIRTKVGDKYIAEEMKKTGAPVGGEASGHIIVGRYQNSGDGLLAAALLTAAVSRNKFEVYDDIKDLPLVEGDILTTPEKVSAYKVIQNEISPLLDKLREGISGRLVVRPSGTEPKIRIMAEADTMPEAYALVARARHLILRSLTDVK